MTERMAPKWYYPNSNIEISLEKAYEFASHLDSGSALMSQSYHPNRRSSGHPCLTQKLHSELFHINFIFCFLAYFLYLLDSKSPHRPETLYSSSFMISTLPPCLWSKQVLWVCLLIVWGSLLCPVLLLGHRPSWKVWCSFLPHAVSFASDAPIADLWRCWFYCLDCCCFLNLVKAYYSRYMLFVPPDILSTLLHPAVCPIWTISMGFSTIGH